MNVRRTEGKVDDDFDTMFCAPVGPTQLPLASPSQGTRSVGALRRVSLRGNSMNKPPAFQMYPKDFLSDGKSMAMNNECFGMYVKLLFFDWTDDGIPDNSDLWWNMVNFNLQNEEGELRGGEILTVYEALLRRCFIPHPKKAGFITSQKLLRYRNHLASVSKVRSAAAHSRDSSNGHHLHSKSSLLQTASFKLQSSEKKTKETHPTIDEVKNYFKTKEAPAIEAEKFFHYYESKGWLVGSKPMKKWHSAAAGWILRNDKGPALVVPITPPKKVDLFECPNCHVNLPERMRRSHMDACKSEPAEA